MLTNLTLRTPAVHPPLFDHSILHHINKVGNSLNTLNKRNNIMTVPGSIHSTLITVKPLSIVQFNGTASQNTSYLTNSSSNWTAYTTLTLKTLKASNSLEFSGVVNASGYGSPPLGSVLLYLYKGGVYTSFVALPITTWKTYNIAKSITFPGPGRYTVVDGSNLTLAVDVSSTGVLSNASCTFNAVSVSAVTVTNV